MNKNKSPLPMLAWTRADYLAAGEEIPEALMVDDLHTEGELMSREDVDTWITDTYKTFSIIRELDETRFEDLYQDFCLECTYLVKLGKITPEEKIKLENKDLYTH